MTFNFCGQALDNLWICLSNLCPSVLELDRGSTVLGLYLDSASTNPLHDLFLDGHWTGIGQGLDKHWILRPISVQPTIGQLYRLFSSSVTLDASRRCQIRVGSDQQRLVCQPDRDPRGDPDPGRTLVARVEDVDKAAVVEAKLRAGGRFGGGGRR